MTPRRAIRADVMLLRALLFFQIFYTVYELHFQFPTGIPGINVVNLIFLCALVSILMSKPISRRQSFTRCSISCTCVAGRI